jgi:hypothetical protein
MSTATPAPATEPLEQSVKKALRAFIKYPNSKNYRAVVALLDSIQAEYVADFQTGSK